MISQNFDSTKTGLTTIFFKDGAFRSTYNGPELSTETQAELDSRIEFFNSRPHDLAEKEKTMLEKSTDAITSEDDIPTESNNKDEAPASKIMKAISSEEHEALK